MEMAARHLLLSNIACHAALTEGLPWSWLGARFGRLSPSLVRLAEMAPLWPPAASSA